MSSATVTLNGIPLAEPSDFTQQSGMIEKTVSLLSDNELSVTVEGAPGSFLTVTVIGTSAEPSVTFSASPETVRTGESAVLTWNTVNAETCTVDHGIGAVPLNGSVTVTPSETVTYTLTAANSSGTVTAQAAVTVIHPAPEVSVSAQPDSVYAGNAVTLTWTSVHAVSAVIDQGIGDVPVSGSLAVHPSETTVYKITVTGPGGTAAGSVSVTVRPVISLQITYPEDGASINRPDTMVRGTVSNARGNETGIIINGVSALVHGNEFAANRVPLENGENTLAAVALDTEENAAHISVSVYAETAENHIRLMTGSDSGLSPLEMNLKTEGTFTVDNSSLAHTGHGSVEIRESGTGEYKVKLTGEGIFYLTCSVTDGQGAVHTDTAAVNVLEKSTADAFFKARWNGMATALANKDTEGALKYFQAGSKEKYREIFNAVKDRLPALAADMREIEMREMNTDIAVYSLKREETVRGVTYDVSYNVEFMRNIFGIWEIAGF